MNADLMFGASGDERITPDALFKELDGEFHFTLDAAANSVNAKCELFMGPGGVFDDALTADWGGEGTVAWLNMPYSKCAEFVAKAAEEARKGAVVVALLPARTDTKYWHAHIWDKDRYSPLAGKWDKKAKTYVVDPNVEKPDGYWCSGVRGRFLPGRLKFELHVSPELREWVKAEHRTLLAAEPPPTETDFTDWLKSMTSVTQLPKMALARILQDTPDEGLLESAPFPSCVVIFSQP